MIGNLISAPTARRVRPIVSGIAMSVLALVGKPGAAEAGETTELSKDVQLDAHSRDEQAVRATVQRFLGGIANRDKEAMLEVVLPDGGATLLRDGQPLYMNLRGVVERIHFDPRTQMEE